MKDAKVIDVIHNGLKIPLVFEKDNEPPIGLNLLIGLNKEPLQSLFFNMENIYDLYEILQERIHKHEST